MKKIFAIAAMLAIFFTSNLCATLTIGDTFTLNGRNYEVIGVNLISNPSFNDGLTSWTSGAGGIISPVTINPTGGVDDGTCIVPTSNTGTAGSGSIGTGWAITSGKTYVFDHYVKKITDTIASREGYNVTSLANAVGSMETKVLATDTIEANNVWTLNRLVFTNNVPYGYLQFRARWLGGRFAFDDFLLAEVTESADNTLLVSLIAQCEALVGNKESTEFEAAIALAKTKVNANNAIILNDALTELQERLLDYRIANASEESIVDVTGRLVKNAGFTDLITGWTCGKLSVVNGINPIMYSHFGGLSREIELQNATSPISDNYIQQTITNLRKGYYRFGADLVAWNSNNPIDSITGVYLMCNGALTSVSTHSITGTVAKKFYVEGVVTDSSIIIGLKTASTNATRVYLDNVSLEYMGFDASIYISRLRDEVRNFLVLNRTTLLPGVADELEKAVTNSETDITNEDTLSLYFERLNTVYKHSVQSQTMMTDLQALIMDLNSYLIINSEWPGFEECQAQLVAANGLLTSAPTEIETSGYEDLVTMIAAVVQAKKNYVLSQPANIFTPADLTNFIQSPSFRAPGQENSSTANLTTEGWNSTNVTYGSVDVRTGFNQNKTCFNSWSNGFSSMDVYQNITGLPAGIYSVTCNAMTEPYDINDQHAYISSSLTTAVSPNMTTGNWYDPTLSPNGSGEWEKMATWKVILEAGDTLRIGFASTHNPLAEDGNGNERMQNGWFSVTDFQLLYFGPEICDSIVQADIETEESLIATIFLKGDRNKVTDYIQSARNGIGYPNIYQSLNAARALAKTSNTAFDGFLQGSYRDVAELASGDLLNMDVDAIFTSAIRMADDSVALNTATYLNLPILESKLAAYLSYEEPYNSAAHYLAGETELNEHQIELQNLMSAQKNALGEDLLSASIITNYISQLNVLVPSTFYNSKIGFDDAQYLNGENFQIPIVAKDISSAYNVISYQFTFDFDPLIMEYKGFTTENTLSSGGSVIVNSSESGKLYISFMKELPISGNGNLLALNFQSKKAGEATPSILDFVFNTVSISAITNGMITVVNTYGDVDRNKLIQAYDAALTLQYSVGIDPLPMTAPLPWENWRMASADVDNVTGITANDAGLILQYSARVISSFPVQTSLRSLSSTDADITITQDGNNLVFKSFGNFIGLNLMATENIVALGTPNIINQHMISAKNILPGIYSIGLATAYAPEEGSTFLTIPLKSTNPQTITFDAIVNTTHKAFIVNTITSTSIASELPISIFVNQTNDVLILNNIPLHADICIYDLNGRLLMKKTSTSNFERMSINTLNEGIYFTTVHQGETNFQVRFVKR